MRSCSQAEVSPQRPRLSDAYEFANRDIPVFLGLIRRGHVTTMNIYGKAMTDSKRQAHSRVVEMVMKSQKTRLFPGMQPRAAAIGS